MSSFRITPGNATLQISSPPMYWVTIFLLVVMIVSILAALGAVRGRGQDGLVYFDGKVHATREFIGKRSKVPLVGTVLACAMAFFAWLSVQTTSLRLDRKAGQYTLDSGYGLSGRSLQSGSLADIDHATLETDTGAQRFVLVLQDGQRIGLGGYTDQDGQDQAVAAVNHFLGRSSKDD